MDCQLDSDILAFNFSNRHCQSGFLIKDILSSQLSVDTSSSKAALAPNVCTTLSTVFFTASLTGDKLTLRQSRIECFVVLRAYIVEILSDNFWFIAQLSLLNIFFEVCIRNFGERLFMWCLWCSRNWLVELVGFSRSWLKSMDLTQLWIFSVSIDVAEGCLELHKPPIIPSEVATKTSLVLAMLALASKNHDDGAGFPSFVHRSSSLAQANSLGKSLKKDELQNLFGLVKQILVVRAYQAIELCSFDGHTSWTWPF